MSTTTDSARAALLEQRLAAHAARAAATSGARRILIASAWAGEGKTHLARCLRERSAAVTNGPVRVSELAVWSPPEAEPPSDAGVEWIDGLRLLDGSVLDLDHAICRRIDAAIVVALGLRSRRSDLRECAAQLRALGIAPIACIWNDHAAVQKSSRLFFTPGARAPPEPPGAVPPSGVG